MKPNTAVQPLVLDSFVIERPVHETAQAASLAWLAAAHAEAEASVTLDSSFDRLAFEQQLARVMGRVACGPDRIARRGHVLDDFLHREWDRMQVYAVRKDASGLGTGARSRLFRDVVLDYFRRTYEDVVDPPGDIVHVTCTGYVSPSGAQQLVSERGWGSRTRVTHAYHMGCYAALPALRIAAGAFYAPTALRSVGARVDIVHTELCSLHLDPRRHDLEQLVVQSLFADGFARYSASLGSDRPGLGVLSMDERIVPGSTGDMSWIASDHGMEMTLSRDVPARIAAELRDFVTSLYRRAGFEVAAHLARSAFAIHPGGPKIVDGVGRALELTAAQLAPSHGVLRDHGNMSSATLPHVWARLLDDTTCASGTLVCSLAFGPGLTLCGALFRKQ
ncbi:MAG: 3-oxoacyl-[acyl-carrier-protein] synthase III C-terminal domain-containing protein [Polyangia bacterium]